MAKGSGGNTLVTLYLALYNLASCAGWAYVLLITFKHVSTNSLDTFWADVEWPLKYVQTAALLEILHSMVGMVKSPWFTTLLQVFSRVWVLWAILDVVPATRISIFTYLCIGSWGLVEVPRYLFYALNLFNAVPYPLFWLRYSLFAILYPTGISGELGCTYIAAKFLYENGNLINTKIPLLPFIVFVAATYIPGAPKMYGYMVVTRKKQFAERNGEKPKDAKKQK